jgi:hypothetical protein
LVEDGKGATQRLALARQHHQPERMKRANDNFSIAARVSAPGEHLAYSVAHLAGGLVGERERHDGLRRNPSFD